MEPRYLEPEIETASRETMTRVQETRLREQVQHAYRASPFYRKKFDAVGLKPGEIRTLADIRKIPFTTKDELKQSQADHPLWGDFLAVPLEDCLRIRTGERGLEAI